MREQSSKPTTHKLSKGDNFSVQILFKEFLFCGSDPPHQPDSGTHWQGPLLAGAPIHPTSVLPAFYAVNMGLKVPV
jgi:hypothetical protein